MLKIYGSPVVFIVPRLLNQDKVVKGSSFDQGLDGLHPHCHGLRLKLQAPNVEVEHSQGERPIALSQLPWHGGLDTGNIENGWRGDIRKGDRAL